MGRAHGNSTDDKEYMQSKGIIYQSFSPLCGPCPASDKEELIHGALVSLIGARHGKTGPQGTLNFLLPI